MLFKYHKYDASVNKRKSIVTKLSKLDLHYFWNKSESRVSLNSEKMNDESNDGSLLAIHEILSITRSPSSYSYIVPCYTVYSIFITFTFTLNHNGITSLLPSGGSIQSPRAAIMHVAGAVYTLLDIFYHLARWLSRFVQKNNYFAIARPRPFPTLRISAAPPSFTSFISYPISLLFPLFPHRFFVPRRRKKNAKHLCSHQRCLLSGCIDLPREKSERPRSLRVPRALTWAFISAGA